VGSVYGYDLVSEIPLRRLNPMPGPRGELEVVRSDEAITDLVGRLTGYLEAPGEGAYYAVAEVERGCLICCSRSGNFLVDPRRDRIEVEAKDDPELLEHRILSAAVCMLLSLRGELVLHAAAVEIGDSAVVFCGPTGRGKSTLVRALGELGAPILSEDGVVIAPEDGGWTVHPGARGVRIRPPGEAAARGILQPDPGPPPQPRPLSALIALEPRGDDSHLIGLPDARALPRLTSNLVHTGGRDSIATSFQLLADACAGAETLSLSLPDSLERLPESASTLVHRLSEVPIGSAQAARGGP
jgi:hypothetical protein